MEIKTLPLLQVKHTHYSLKKLSESILGLDIQIGDHNALEDTRATMALYNALVC